MSVPTRDSGNGCGGCLVAIGPKRIIGETISLGDQQVATVQTFEDTDIVIRTGAGTGYPRYQQPIQETERLKPFITSASTEDAP